MDAASSSSSATLPPTKYDVFISFRGEDTRTNFTSHLYEALHQKSVETYIDDKLQKGEEISQGLIQAIHDSSVSLVVFSENYGSSKWCLDELTQIIQCKKEQNVIPIFYKVDPSDVRKQNGSYKEAFAKHERDNPDKVEMWRDALVQAANLAGCDSSTYGNESVLIQDIVKNVLQKLGPMYRSALKGLVGIDENCKCIESLLEKAQIIGIWGMGGIGKTTMTRAVFTKLSSQFESCCFLENVRENGLNYVHDELAKELLKGEIFCGSTSRILGSLRRKLSRKKVFIVLDDVSSSEDLDKLAREYDCLKEDSRVIITSRDKQVLIGKVGKIHEAKALSDPDALRLFSFKAFHKYPPEIGYEQLSERAVTYTKGIPLALSVLGSLLYSKSVGEWESALRKLTRTPDENIQKVLKLSYDGLDYEEKEMFLDIACFWKGESIEYVIRLFESFGYEATIGISRLLDKALIAIDYSQVQMHDLIQGMGRHIVIQENKEPGRRTRLWDPKDIYDVLKYNKGTNKVEGMILDMSQIREVQLSADTFKNMPNLKFLKMYSSKRSSNVYLPFGLESFSDRLRYFYWDRYPLESLPLTSCAENLVELTMIDSRVKKLWDGVQDLVNLERVNLEQSEQLVELPDFSKAPKLELLNLWFCKNLCNVHPSISSLPKLHSLILNCCFSLKSLRCERDSESLTDLRVNNCSSLKELSLSSEKVTSLKLYHTGIEILDLSIECLNKVRKLTLNGSTLENLPINKICCFTSLESLEVSSCKLVIEKPILHNLFNALHSLDELYLEECSNLDELPYNISNLSSLRILSLKGSSVESLPSSIKHLSKLEDIRLSECKRLRFLPQLPSSLRRLSLKGSNVESLPSSIKHLSKLEYIQLSECRRLRSLPQLPPFLKKLFAANCTSLETAFTLSTNHRMELVFLVNCMKLDEHSLWGIMVDAYFSSMRRVFLVACGLVDSYVDAGTEFIYPGSRAPEWFRHNRTTEASLTIELAKPLDNFMGFIFCLVVPQFFSFDNLFKFQVFLEYGGERWIEQGYRKSIFDLSDRIDVSLNSDYFFLWYDASLCFFILYDVTEKQEEHGTAYNLKVSFKFERQFGDCLIKEFGVYPVYALEHHNLVEEVNLHLKEKKWTKTKGQLVINEEDQLLKRKLKARNEFNQEMKELILRTTGIEDGD